jgi:hypothetical protein
MDIHASSGIGSHAYSVLAGEDSSCLRPRDHCDRHINVIRLGKYKCIIDEEVVN